MIMMYGMTALNEYNRKAAQDPQYAAMMRKRPAKKHRTFEIGHGIYFEFWGAHEWEFSVLPLYFDKKTCYHLAHELFTNACCIGPSADNLHRIVKMARKTVANYLHEQ